MKNIILGPALVIACLALCACAAATVASSGVQRASENGYTVYVSMKGRVSGDEDNSGKTKARALSDANAFCTQQGLGLAYVINEQVIKDKTAGIVLNFTCGA